MQEETAIQSIGNTSDFLKFVDEESYEDQIDLLAQKTEEELERLGIQDRQKLKKRIIILAAT